MLLVENQAYELFFIEMFTLQRAYPQQARLMNQDFIVVKQAKELSYAQSLTTVAYKS